jgi:hypothetical protein
MQGGHGRSPGKPSPPAIWCPLRTRCVSARPGDVPKRIASVRASLREYPVTVFPEIAHLSPFSVTASVDSLCGEALTASPAVGSGGCGQKLLTVSARFSGPGCATPTFLQHRRGPFLCSRTRRRADFAAARRGVRTSQACFLAYRHVPLTGTLGTERAPFSRPFLLTVAIRTGAACSHETV